MTCPTCNGLRLVDIGPPVPLTRMLRPDYYRQRGTCPDCNGTGEIDPCLECGEHLRPGERGVCLECREAEDGGALDTRPEDRKAGARVRFDDAVMRNNIPEVNRAWRWYLRWDGACAR